jgi:hypothetical protein
MFTASPITEISAHGRLAGIDPDANIERHLALGDPTRIKFRECLPHLHSGSHGVDSVLPFTLSRDAAPLSHHGVADEFVQSPAILENDCDHLVKVLV